MTQHIGKHDADALRKVQVKVKKIRDLLQEREISKEQAKGKLLDFIQKQRAELENGQEFLNSMGRK